MLKKLESAHYYHEDDTYCCFKYSNEDNETLDRFVTSIKSQMSSNVTNDKEMENNKFHFTPTMTYEITKKEAFINALIESEYEFIEGNRNIFEHELVTLLVEVLQNKRLESGTVFYHVNNFGTTIVPPSNDPPPSHRQPISFTTTTSQVITINNLGTLTETNELELKLEITQQTLHNKTNRLPCFLRSNDVVVQVIGNFDLLVDRQLSVFLLCFKAKGAVVASVPCQNFTIRQVSNYYTISKYSQTISKQLFRMKLMVTDGAWKVISPTFMLYARKTKVTVPLSQLATVIQSSQDNTQMEEEANTRILFYFIQTIKIYYFLKNHFYKIQKFILKMQTESRHLSVC